MGKRRNNPEQRWSASEQTKIARLIRRGLINSEGEIPIGAIVADVSKQRSCSCMGMSRPFYEDYWFDCQDCGKRELWTAGQQHWWYEVAGGEIESVAIRCRACRRQKRESAAEQREKITAARATRASERALELADKLRRQGRLGLLDRPVTDLVLTHRALALLAEAGIATLSDLVATTNIQLNERFPGRSRALEEIKGRLLKSGLKFVGAPIPRSTPPVQ